MNGWHEPYLGLIIQVYGLAFFILGVVAYLLPRQDTTLRFSRDLWLLAAFGMSHGVMEFVEWQQLHTPARWLAAASSLLLAFSYVALLEFGRRTLAATHNLIQLPAVWVYGITGLGVAALTWTANDPLAGLAIGSRYFMGLPGALFTGFAFLALLGQATHPEAGFSRGLTAWRAILASAFLGYGVLIPFVSVGDAALPAWLPTTDDFLPASGLPIQLLRGLCAIAATLSLLALVRQAGARTSDDLQRILGTLKGFVYRCNNDRDWSFLHLSGNVEELCGYTADEFLGSHSVTWGELIHPDDATWVWDEVQKAMREHREFELSYRISPRHCGLRWVYERGRGVFNDSGRLLFQEGHITDATALVQASETLRIKDAAIESSINAIAMAGLDGRISYVNPAFIRLWQLNGAQDALGHSPVEFWDNPQEARAVVEALQQHGSWQGELRAHRADGSLMDLQLSANAVFDDAGKLVCMMSSFVDLSDRIQAELKIQESARRLNLTQSMAQLGSWEWDIESGALDWSDEMFRLFGYEPGAIAPTYDLFAQTIHPLDRGRELGLITRAVEEGTPYETEFRIVRQDGAVRFVAARGEVRHADDGRPLLMFGMGQDITARHAAEEATQVARRQLQAVIDAATQVAIIATDEHGLIALFNRGAEQMLGYRAEDMVGKHTPASLHDAVEIASRADALSQEYDQPIQRADVLFEPVRRGNTAPREWTLIRKDGMRLTVSLGITSLRDELGKLTGFLVVATDITARAELLARLNKIGRNAPGMIYQFQLRADGSSCFPYASAGIRDIFGVTPEEVATDASMVFGVGHPADVPRVIDSIQFSAQELTPWHAQFRVNHPAKGEIWVEGRASPERLPDGSVLWHGANFDITEQKQAEMALARSLEELRQSEERQHELLVLTQREQSRMAALLSGMSIGILFEDRDSRVEYVNPAFRHMWAIPDNVDLEGWPTREVLDHSTHRLARPDHASKHILHVLDTHETSERFEVDLDDGRILTQLSYPVSDPDGRAIGRLWIYEDITHERQTAQQLIYLAEHDALTGLYNRHRFQEHLERTISASSRSGARFGLLYFDLDEFKYINDTFGHRAGDTVLMRAAGEVASLVRGGEMFARVGGDEFAILVEMSNGDEPVQLAERVVHAISAIPFRFRGSNFRLTASIGITLFPQHGDNAEDLVAHADTAMYQAKGCGKNTWAVYDATRNTAESMLARMTWSSRIAQALDQQGLELHFQGIYHTRDGSLSHLEALLRMQDPLEPERLIMPGQFIPIAEKNGQILEIDRWVIRRSIETLARHPDLAALAVNVSGRSFDEPGLPRFIQEQLGLLGVAPQRLIIELTETAAVSEMQDAQRFIEALQQTGCLICLDDFGSGFSTFAYLKYLGAQILKIDGMFIRDLPNNRDNQAFVKAMIDVARGLGKVTVAEFVESAATLEMLRSFGVDMAQGYFLDRPSAHHPSLD
jgi:diguanylate cyclase (GGDEF)-like protein/PAS domain S-box-containing protein